MSLWHQSGRTVPGRQDQEWARLVAPPRFAAAVRPEPAAAEPPSAAPGTGPNPEPEPASEVGPEPEPLPVLTALSVLSADRPRETR
ncbi:hypothetical protein ACFV1L_09450 [Kitasatospora sp. NPDC059646]|uniref:hypothetical protein n=1 Tax=Kitasatospora sp. NPDC059646 TaxID=3346893 RepID=UPI003679744B